MALSKQWKLAGAAVAVAGIGLGGIAGASSGGGDDFRPTDGIPLRDSTSLTTVAPTTIPTPTSIVVPHDDSLGSIDGESLDSPLQSADDSPEGADSVDSIDSPPAPAPPPPPAPAPAPAPRADSVDSPASFDSASADSAGSVDSP